MVRAFQFHHKTHDMDSKEEPSSLNLQSDIAVLVAPNETIATSHGPIKIGAATSSSRGGGRGGRSDPTSSSQNDQKLNPRAGGDAIGGSRQISTGTSDSSKTFSCKNYLTRRLPILKWFPLYKVQSDLIPDAISGVTVGLTAIPQSMAYAAVAGLTPEVRVQKCNSS